MNVLSRQAPLAALVLGRHPLVRRHTLFSLSTGLFYVVVSGVSYHAAWLGVQPLWVANVLVALMAAVFLTFYALVRSGWSQRFDDPVLTLPHAMTSQLITVLAYVLLGSSRADVAVLLAQAIAISMFRLRPLDILFLGWWTVGWLGLAQVGLIVMDVPDFDTARAIGHALVGCGGLLALAIVGKWVSEIRVRISRQARELQDTLAQAQALATTDLLTGLLNRRRMLELLSEEIAKAQRTHKPLSLALIDIDHFKRINDQHGHRTGDEVLRALAELAQVELRSVDRLARWGGEEFLLLMPHVEAGQAWGAADRFRRQLAVLHQTTSSVPAVSCSAGIAQWNEHESLDAWLERADRALYQAKRQGRNRCVVADVPELHTPSPEVVDAPPGGILQRGT